jgi:hypothetical protein
MPDIPHDVLIREASHQMLGKQRPRGRDDWVKVMNFVAWNVDFRNCLEVCCEIARLYNAPLKRKEIQDIVDFQTYDRAARELALQEKAAMLLSDAAIREVNEFMGEQSRESGRQKGGPGTSIKGGNNNND